MSYKFFVLVTVITIFVTSGCASLNPVIPSDPYTVISAEVNPESANSSRTLWGLWQIAIDPADGTAEVIPVRDASLHVNVRQFLENSPCTDCLQVVPPLLITPEGIDANIRIIHPFPGDSVFTGFDVRGIVMLEGDYYFPMSDVLTTKASAGGWSLLNPDGWTGMFNAQDFTQPGIFGYAPGKMIPSTWPDPTNTLNAFKAFYSVGQGEDDGKRRAFLAGDSVTRTYSFQLVDSEPFHFWYAIDACWEPPPGDPPYDPEDFPISANCPEPYRIDLSVVAGEFFENGGSVTIGLDAWDHQGWGDFTFFQVESPDCTNAVMALLAPPDYTDGDMAHWEFGLTNTKTLIPGEGAEVLVSFTGTDPNFGLVEGYGRINIPVTPSGSECNDALHTNYLGTGEYSYGMHMPALDLCFVHDTGSLSDGEMMTYISGFAGTICSTVIVDSTTPEDGHGMGGSNWGNPYIGEWPTPTSIDVSEEMGRFFIVWSGHESNVEEWTFDDGIVLNITDASNTGQVRGLDTDGNGGWWNGYFPEVGFAQGIKHFVPNASMEFSEVSVDHISLPEAWGLITEVIVIPDDTLLILTGLQDGKIRAYDISISPPVMKGEISGIFSGGLDFGTYPSKACDMDADMTDPDLARCRIVIWGNLESGGGELVKIDSDLNILAGPVSVASSHFESMVLNTDEGHVTLWPMRNGSPGIYGLVELPVGW